MSATTLFFIDPKSSVFDFWHEKQRRWTPAQKTAGVAVGEQREWPWGTAGVAGEVTECPELATAPLVIKPRFGYVFAMLVLPLPRMILRAAAAFMVLALVALVVPAQAGADESCALTNRGMARMQLADIALLNADRQRVKLRAFIADEPVEMAAGYQHICPEVVARTAILFRYAAPSAGRFHMHNVKAPLDIAFFDAGGALFQAMEMQPYHDGEEVLYGPMRKFQYALEARRGFLRARNLTAGASMLILETLPDLP